jgi:hypothetical protein
MRSALVLMVLSVCAIPQDKPPVVAPACGRSDVNFDVKRDQTQHALGQPEPGKALVYFVQDLGQTRCLTSCVTVKIGLDGAWVGANQDNSYFSMSVEPGEHHVCATPQSRELRRLVGLAHFTAEVGKTYYLRTRLFGDQNQQLIDLGLIDSDQAGYFVASYPLSVSHPKP